MTAAECRTRVHFWTHKVLKILAYSKSQIKKSRMESLQNLKLSQPWCLQERLPSSKSIKLQLISLLLAKIVKITILAQESLVVEWLSNQTLVSTHTKRFAEIGRKSSTKTNTRLDPRRRAAFLMGSWHLSLWSLSPIKQFKTIPSPPWACNQQYQMRSQELMRRAILSSEKHINLLSQKFSVSNFKNVNLALATRSQKVCRRLQLASHRYVVLRKLCRDSVLWPHSVWPIVCLLAEESPCCSRCLL